MKFKIKIEYNKINAFSFVKLDSKTISLVDSEEEASLFSYEHLERCLPLIDTTEKILLIPVFLKEQSDYGSSDCH